MKCDVCHEALETEDQICQGTLPGALGKTAHSAGPCHSTQAQREVLRRKRIAAAAAAPSEPS
jgi:hypothetical protein